MRQKSFETTCNILGLLIIYKHIVAVERRIEFAAEMIVSLHSEIFVYTLKINVRRPVRMPTTVEKTEFNLGEYTLHEI